MSSSVGVDVASGMVAAAGWSRFPRLQESLRPPCMRARWGRWSLKGVGLAAPELEEAGLVGVEVGAVLEPEAGVSNSPAARGCVAGRSRSRLVGGVIVRS